MFLFEAVMSHPKVRLGSYAWCGIPLRVVITTLLVTLMSFAIALLLGLLGLIITAKVRAVAPNLTTAYRHIALPTAIAIGAATFVVSTTMEVRHYRQTKALARIEDISSGA